MKKKGGTPAPRHESKKLTKSVYPDEFVVPILGATGSGVFGRALELGAMVLARCTRENETRFTPAQWRLLARIVAPLDLPMSWVGVGDLLADQIEHQATQHLFGEEAKDLKALAGLLRKMQHEEVHAIIWAVRWAREADIGFDTEGWWTLNFRATHTPPV